MAKRSRFFQSPKGSFFLFGPRGTGKSTWLKEHFQDALFIDLLDPETLRALRAKPERLRDWVQAESAETRCVIDEVQYLPELLPVVHELIENGNRAFVLTGSSARKLRRGGVNLLAGRAVPRHLHPYLAAELDKDFDLERALTIGLIPLVVEAADPADTLRGYVGLYIQQEVKAEALVRDIGAFSRFLETMSFSHGSTLNLSSVARECEVPRKTAESYLEVLEDLLLGFRLPVFGKRARRALVKQTKFYFFDPGVFKHLRPRGPLDEKTLIEGPALEGLVAEQLRAWHDYSNSDTKLFYWRTRSGVEVDFVLYGPDCFVAIEVKNSARVRPEDLKGLRTFHADYPEAKVLLLYRGSRKQVIDGIACEPVDGFLRRLLPGKALL